MYRNPKLTQGFTLMNRRVNGKPALASFGIAEIGAGIGSFDTRCEPDHVIGSIASGAFRFVGLGVSPSRTDLDKADRKNACPRGTSGKVKRGVARLMPVPRSFFRTYFRLEAP